MTSQRRRNPRSDHCFLVFCFFDLRKKFHTVWFIGCQAEQTQFGKN